MNRTDDEAEQLLTQAAKLLHEDDPDWFEGGCWDVANVLAEYARRRGIEVRVAAGQARARKAGSFPHAWLVVRNRLFDPIVVAGGPRISGHIEGLHPFDCLDEDEIADDVNHRIEFLEKMLI